MHLQNGCYLEFHYFVALGHKFLDIYDSKIENLKIRRKVFFSYKYGTSCGIRNSELRS